MTVTVSSFISVSGNLVHFNATWWKLLVLICFWQFQQISFGLNIAQHVCYDRWGRGFIGGQKSRGCRLQVCAFLFCLKFKHWCDLWIFFSNKNLHNYPVVIKCTLTKVDKIFLVKHFNNWFWHPLPGWEGGGQRHRDGHPGEHRLGPDQDRHPDQDVLRPVIRRRLAGGTLTVLRTPKNIVHPTLFPPRWLWARVSVWVWTMSCPRCSTCTAAASASSPGSAAACCWRCSGVSWTPCWLSVTLLRKYNTSLMKRMTKRRRQALDGRKLPEFWSNFLYSLWLL